MVRAVSNPIQTAGRGSGAYLTAPKVYLVGGGIASLAAAVFMICDGDVFGHNITMIEELDRLGGSFDGRDNGLLAPLSPDPLAPLVPHKPQPIVGVAV